MTGLQLRDSINELYNRCPSCGGFHNLAADREDERVPDNEDLFALYGALVEKVYAGEIAAGQIDHETAIATAKDFMQAVTSGYGKTLAQVDYDTPDHEMLKSLEKNVYQFSGAKNYQELKALTEALHDGERLRTKKEFLDESKKIVTEFNKTWREAEYDTAVGASQMAGKWVGFEKNAGTMPLLKFIAVADERECPICKPFNNVVRPIDDAFWKYAYPVLHYRCRCDVVQLADGTPTADADVPNSDTIPKLFRTNIAQQGLAFPPDHPYYQGVPKKVLNKFVKQNLPKDDA